MAKKYQFRRDATSAWESENPVLSDGEIGIEKLADGSKKIKIGDGVSAWISLSYWYGTSEDTVISDATNITGATTIKNIIRLQQTDYDNITTPDPDTLYIITE